MKHQTTKTLQKTCSLTQGFIRGSSRVCQIVKNEVIRGCQKHKL